MNPLALDNVQSLSWFFPEFALTAGVVLVVLWDLVTTGRNRIRGVTAIALAALLTSGGLSMAYLVNALHKQVQSMTLFQGLLAFDPFSHLLRVIFAFVAAIVIVFAAPSEETGALDKKRRGAGEFFALLLVITLGLNLMVMSRNLLMIYLSLELVSVISFVMAGFKINDRKSAESALKYVIYGGTASGIMLYGMSWLFGISQTLDIGELGKQVVLLTQQNGNVPLVVLVGVGCVIAGFGYKISAAPFHMWTPDVYEGAPTSITAFLSVGPKAAGFAVLLRFFEEGLHATSHTAAGDITPWALLAGLLAMGSMVMGNFTALHQDNVKRMLAYSSIAHAGYMLLGFGVFDIVGKQAILFYIVTYAFMNLGAFLVVAAVAERNGNDETLTAFQGLGSRSPVLAVTMAIFLFSLTGLPPFAGFVGKFYIFAALIRAGGNWNWFLAAVGVVNSVVSLFYYARVLRAMYLTPAAKPEPFTTREEWLTTTIALAVPTLLLGVYWGPIYDFMARSLALPH